MSYIFQLVVGPESCGRSNFGYYRECLRRALVLSSVSPRFRYFAFGTPELWNRIPLRITESKAIGEVSSLLQHCISRAPNVTICVSDGGRDRDHGDVRSVIETLLTLDTARKVKAFHIYDSDRLSTWISRLTSSSFPSIQTLIITYSRQAERFSIFDFGTLDNLTRVVIYGAWLHFPIIVPPSVQYLDIGTVSQEVFVSLLYQCPNLVECSVDVATQIHGPQFTKPLTLDHLIRLDTGTLNFNVMSSSLQNFQLPSLQFLQLYHFECHFLDLLPFYRNVSATLTSLTILTHSSTLDYDDLYQLCRSPFPKLEVLKIDSAQFGPFASAIRVLSLLDGECNNPRPLHLPALRSMTLRSRFGSDRVAPRVLLDVLKNWWTGDALHLRFELESYWHGDEDWTLALREELRLIVGSRQIEVRWGPDKTLIR